MDAKANAARLTGALREMLAAERRLVASGTPRSGWAEGHTRSVDVAMSAALVLVDRVLGVRAPGDGVSAGLPVGGRPIYRPLAAYALARGGVVTELLREEAARGANPTSAVGVWWGLTRYVLDGDAAALQALIARQRPTGEFYDASPYDSPDLHWYDELVVLHAVATFAALSGEGHDAAARAAAFHTAETQPDHATTQPWAVHAFAASVETYPLAELLLHGTMAQNAGRLDTVSQVLLADAVLALEST